MTDQHQELKPCPFCGGDGVTVEWLRSWGVECSKCGAISGDNCDSQADAISAWNTRHEAEQATGWRDAQGSAEAIKKAAEEIELAVHKAVAAITSGCPPEFYRGDISAAALKLAEAVAASTSPSSKEGVEP